MSDKPLGAKVKVTVNDVEVVDKKRSFLKISTPSIIENVRALRKAAGLEDTGATGPSSVTG